MSKYVIELGYDLQRVVGVGVKQGTVWVKDYDIDNLEELCADYINEHFGDLQDTAYQKGFEDGKARSERGCEGCEYAGKVVTGLPCISCCNSYKNQWTAKDDKIKVGDEVTHKSDSVDWKAVCIQIDCDGWHMNLMGHTGAVGYYPVDDFKKTGRHFDIEKILEAMKA